MEKIKVSREVADAIERLRYEDFTDYGIILSTHKKHENKNVEVLRKWTYQVDAEKLLMALVNGYEIESEKPKFQPGDKVIRRNSNKIRTLHSRRDTADCMGVGKAWNIDQGHTWVGESELQHATLDEIYWLETVGREKVNDFKKGDAVLDADGSLTRITTQYHINQAVSWYRDRSEELIGIYPEESFKPFAGGDKE